MKHQTNGVVKANVYHIDTKDSYIIVGLVPIVTYYNQKVDAIAGERFVPEGIACPIVKTFVSFVLT